MLATHQKPYSSQGPEGDALAALQALASNDAVAFRDETPAAQLLEQLRWHRVTLRLPRHVVSSLPSSQRQRYEHACRVALAKTAVNILSLSRIARCLDAHGIPYLSLKGPALAQFLYGSALVKESGDIDILVRPQDTLAALDALQSIDILSSTAVPRDPQIWKTFHMLGKDWLLRDHVTGCRVELHWKVEINPFLLPTRFADWYARRSSVAIGGTTINTLCRHDLFIQVMVHGARSMWTQLHWLLDFDALLRREDIDWQQVHRTVSDDNLQEMLLYSWQLSQRLLATPLPAPLAVLIENASLDQQGRTQALVDRSVHAMRQHESIQWLSLRRCHQLLKRGWRFQLFEFFTLVGPHQPDVMQLPLPIYLLPVYFLLRPWFVLSRLLKQPR